MIKDLQDKALNEKYYKSIRYFSHSLKGNDRRVFISEVAKFNVYLAAQCIMSCEKDLELEKTLSVIAHSNSNQDEIELKVSGYLGLIELNRYDLIVKLISELPTKIEKIHRFTIRQIIDEIDSEEIVKFFKLIVDSKNTGIINSVITSVSNREISFDYAQKKEIEKLYIELEDIFGADSPRILKFHMAFDLSKHSLPKNLNYIAERMLRKAGYKFVKAIYEKHEIPFPFSNYELCKIFMNRNNQSNTLAFRDAFFNILNEHQQIFLLREMLPKGKYSTAFCLSLVEDKKERNSYLFKMQDYTNVGTKILPLLNKQITEKQMEYIDHNQYQVSLLIKEYPTIKQDLIRKVICDYLESNSTVSPSIVRCKVIGLIPKTIYIEVVETKEKGSIWIKEFTTEKVDDINQIAKIGDEFDAVVIGFYGTYLQLSVNQLDKKNSLN